MPQRKLRILDLFSGIGGFSLGLESTGGFETAAFCEPDPFCRKVLRKHWPNIEIFYDVKGVANDPERKCEWCGDYWCDTCEQHYGYCGCFTALDLDARIGPIDVITAGWPCQDISTAGKKEGLSGERSGLWREVARLIGVLEPRYIVLENVAALLSRGAGDVLGDLASLGYNAEWHCIPLAALGAPHRRDRWYCIAQQRRGAVSTDPGRIAPQVPIARRLAAVSEPARHPQWESKPGVGRVADGVPDRLDRLKALGNSVSPAIIQMLGEAILEMEGRGNA